MSVKITVYASEIATPKSIISLFDGSEQFCIENPWFDVPGMRKIDRKEYVIRRPSSNNNRGIYYTSPKLLIKTPTGVFTNNFVIGYGKNKVKKQYKIGSLFDANQSKITSRYNHKLSVGPASFNQIDVEETNLIKLEYALNMALEVLLLSIITNVDLSKFKGMHDNKIFYDAFTKEVTRLVRLIHNTLETEFTIDDKLVESFNTIPLIYHQNTKVFLVSELGKPKTQIKPLMLKFVEWCMDEDITRIFKQHTDIIKENSTFIPIIARRDYCKKNSTEHKEIYEMKLMFNVKLQQGDKGFNPNFKDFVYTKQMLTEKNQVILNADLFAQLWGATYNDPASANGAKHEGMIFIYPQIEYSFYNNGNLSIKWKVDKLILKKMANKPAQEYDECNEFMCGSDNGSEEEYFNNLGPKDDSTNLADYA